MSRLLDAIDSVGSAADTLTRACARRGALVDSAVANDNPFGTTIRRLIRTSAATPVDMLQMLGKMK